MMTTIGLRTRLKIGTWNIRTMLQAGRLAQAEREMTIYKLDILGLSEMLWNGNGEIVTNNYNTVIYTGNPSTGQQGVGLLVSPKLKRCLVKWSPVSSRIITATFRCRPRNVIIIQCYAPTEDAEEEEKDIFYEELNETIRSSRDREIKLVIGDMNAKVGNNNTHTRVVMGRYGMGGAANNNGKRLIELCLTNQLVIGGTLFPHKNIHKYTWEAPNGRTRNQIDHICLSRNARKYLEDVRTKRGADIQTDHQLLVANLKMKGIGKKKSKITNTKINLDELNNQEKKEELVERLSKVTPINGDWGATTEEIKKIGEEVLGRKTSKKQEWISEDTWGLVDQRKNIRKQMLQQEGLNNNNMDNLRSEYKRVAKAAKKSVRIDKRNLHKNIATQAEQAAQKNDLRRTYQNIRKLAQEFIPAGQPVYDNAGNLVTNTDDQLEVWTQYFNRQGEEDNEEREEEPSSNPARINCNEPNKKEIVEAIERLKKHKAPGSDGIPSDILKADAGISTNIIYPYIVNVWNTETLPDEWKEGIIVKIPKKGDKRQCRNWRGITLLNTINKIMAQIICTRIEKHIDLNMRDEQAGFRANRSCVDQANTLRIIMEQAEEWNTPLYAVFVDFEQAYDSLKRSMIWKALRRKRIPEKIIRIIKAMYENTSSRVLHNGQLGEPFITKQGVRQGCVLSPTLFNVALDEVMRDVNRRPRGISWTLENRLEDLDYADDICLLAHTHNDIQSKLDDLAETAAKYGLRINTGKTKCFRRNARNRSPIKIYGANIEEVEEFCYLGCMMAAREGTTKDIESKLNKARMAYGRLHKVWRSQHITRNIKVRIFEASVKSVLLYGSETWRLTKKDTHKIQVFINKCLRRICRIFWPNKISNQDLWDMTSQEPVTKTIRRRRWKWIGHTLRRSAESINRVALEWNPQGSRKRGRPKLTWKRTILKEAQEAGWTWQQIKNMAQNRVRWRACVESLCSLEER